VLLTFIAVLNSNAICGTGDVCFSDDIIDGDVRTSNWNTSAVYNFVNIRGISAGMATLIAVLATSIAVLLRGDMTPITVLTI
jgi:hypothetical protein